MSFVEYSDHENAIFILNMWGKILQIEEGTAEESKIGDLYEVLESTITANGIEGMERMINLLSVFAINVIDKQARRESRDFDEILREYSTEFLAKATKGNLPD